MQSNDPKDAIILRCVTDAIYDMPLVKGRMSLPEISDLATLIYHNLERNRIFNIATGKRYLISSPINTYKDYCKRNNSSPRNDLLNYLRDNTSNVVYYQIVGSRKYVSHRGNGVLIPEFLLTKK